MNLNESDFYNNQFKLSIDEILVLIENTNDITHYNKMDPLLFLDVFPKCSSETKKKIIENINVPFVVLLFNNNLIDIWQIFENELIFSDFNNTIELLNQNNILKMALNYLDDRSFSKNIHKVSYYNLFDLLNAIKNNKAKLNIFINGINYLYLDLLISRMDQQLVEYITNNISFLLKLELVGNLFTFTSEQIQNTELSKLQILLLLGSNYESLIINKIFSFEIGFIRNIVNLISDENFITFFNLSSIDLFYQYINVIRPEKINLIINLNLNRHIINNILKNTNIENINKIIEKLNIHQIIDATYELCDEKIILISKSLNNEHQSYLYFLFNNINNFENIIYNVSKQMLCFLIMNPNIKRVIINNFNKLSNSQILILINLLNSEDIYTCLQLVDFNKKNIILGNLDKNQITHFSDFIDRKLDNFQNDIPNIRDKILFKSMSLLIKLNLSTKNECLIRNIE